VFLGPWTKHENYFWPEERKEFDHPDISLLFAFLCGQFEIITVSLHVYINIKTREAKE
jgi:hypothetical protein